MDKGCSKKLLNQIKCISKPNQTLKNLVLLKEFKTRPVFILKTSLVNQTSKYNWWTMVTWSSFFLYFSSSQERRLYIIQEQK